MFNHNISGQGLWNPLFHVSLLPSQFSSCGDRLCDESACLRRSGSCEQDCGFDVRLWWEAMLLSGSTSVMHLYFRALHAEQPGKEHREKKQFFYSRNKKLEALSILCVCVCLFCYIQLCMSWSVFCCCEKTSWPRLLLDKKAFNWGLAYSFRG